MKAIRVVPAGDAGAQAAWSVEHGDGEWTVTKNGSAAPANDAAVTTWVEALLALEARDAPAAESAPEATVTLEKPDGTAFTLVLGTPKDGRRSVTCGTYRMETDQAGLLPAPDALAAPAKPDDK